jgi:hypothetical protein
MAPNRPTHDGDEDDVTGHLRMTDDQLASGTTPHEVLDTRSEKAEQQEPGDPDA